MSLEDRVEKLHAEVLRLKEVVLSMSNLLAERLMAPGEVDGLIKNAWKRAHPTRALTWNADMTGDEFVGLVRKNAGSDLGRVMEIGPGYGRLITSILRDQLGFAEYLGVDISPQNVPFLREKFGREGERPVRFENADFFEFEPPAPHGRPFDTIISAAVFLHLYPSVEPAMKRCRALLRDGGRLCFDVPGGRERYVDISRQNFVRSYTPEELKAIADAAGYSSCTVDPEPGFSPQQRGWFVCATM